MNLRDDFKRPLNEIENVLLRRIALIITSFVMIPVIVTLGVVCGILDATVEIREIFVLCWKGEK
jgi:type III secretory pathway component EscR